MPGDDGNGFRIAAAAARAFALAGLAAPIPATAILHTAYLLRSPAQKREAWRDLLMIKAKLDSAL